MYSKSNRHGNSFSFNSIIILIFIEFSLLIIQFILGMWMNLFAVYPNIHSSSYGTFSGMRGMFSVMQAMFSVPELMVHMMMGVLILFISLIILILTIVRGNPALIILGFIAFVSIAVAGIGGMEFVLSGFSNNVFSFMMSLGFLFTVVSYALSLYFIHQ